MIDDDLFVPKQDNGKSESNDFFAEIASVHSDGVSLLIDGKVTQKHYLVNTSCRYSVGAKVKVIKIDGTYIVEYVVGKPN